MATLKISDLSVGDWVICNGFKATIAGYNVESGSIQVLTKQKNKMWFGLDDIEPIPITAEILEKIGFERLLERDLFYHSESGLEVAFEDGEWMHTINLHEYTIHTISGVHHIQHLLRLYGCEKEINL
jgi:hypothetical protein